MVFAEGGFGSLQSAAHDYEQIAYGFENIQHGLSRKFNSRAEENFGK
jgi:hypothetical protein